MTASALYLAVDKLRENSTYAYGIRHRTLGIGLPLSSIESCERIPDDAAEKDGIECAVWTVAAPNDVVQYIRDERMDFVCMADGVPEQADGNETLRLRIRPSEWKITAG